MTVRELQEELKKCTEEELDNMVVMRVETDGYELIHATVRNVHWKTTEDWTCLDGVDWAWDDQLEFEAEEREAFMQAAKEKMRVLAK